MATDNEKITTAARVRKQWVREIWKNYLLLLCAHLPVGGNQTKGGSRKLIKNEYTRSWNNGEKIVSFIQDKIWKAKKDSKGTEMKKKACKSFP